MQPTALRIVLLLAVSLSQIAGGPSCCCLPRFLATALTLSLHRNLRLQAASENLSKEVDCPECCRHRIESKTLTLASNPVPSTERTDGVFSDGKCTCIRHMSVSAPDERPSVEHKPAPQQPFCAVLCKFDRPPTPTNTNTAYSPPMFHRPVGRSWQCLACVWIS